MRVATTNQRRSTEARGDSSERWEVAGHYDPEFTEAVCAQLDELATLKRNWDCYGAPVIDRSIIAAACRFVRSLPEDLAYRPRVVPMSPGNLQLEWHHGSKILELEFEDSKTIRFLQWYPEQCIKEENVFSVTDVEKAVELIQWFMSGTCV